VLVQGYGFTSVPIADALIAAHQRGVRVEVLLDRSNQTAPSSEAGAVAKAGIPVWIDAHHPIAHNKVLIIDGRILLTGSFNWTKQAEANAENLLLISDPALAKRYADNWNAHKAHSTPFSP
jgi:phosphatidylserine/phosphatidylglycerophosphate/cardiolipin synthase-like enzyme